MRVLHLIPRLVAGGAERQLIYLSLELARRGHDVHVGFLAGSLIPEELEGSMVSLHPIAHRSTYDPMLLIRVFHLVRAKRPDILQTWILQMDVIGGVVAYVTGTPWILREPANAKLWIASVKSRLRIIVARVAHAVVSNSAAGDAYWRGRKFVPQRRIIPNAVPCEAIAAVKPIDRALLGLRAAGKLILFAGRLDDRQKNVKVLVAALIKVVRDTGANAILFGSGPLRDELLSQIARSGMERQIKLESYSSQLWSVMKVADVLISPSIFEGRPNVVLEAMAAGCPVVVSDIPEHREILNEESAFFIQQYLDPLAVAGCLAAALSRPDLSGQKSACARRRVAEFTIERLGEEYETLYEAIIKGGSRSISARV